MTFTRKVQGTLASMLAICLLLPAAPSSAFAATDSSDTSSRVSESAASSSAAAAITLVPSPELLSKKEPDSAPSVDGEEGEGPFRFTGTYTGATRAANALKEAHGQTTATARPDRAAALACEEGTLVMAEGKLVKLGNASDASTSLAYGNNAIGLAVGAYSNLLLSSMVLESAATGGVGVFAVDGGCAYANETTVVTRGSDSGGVAATYGGLLVTSALDAQTNGPDSPAVRVESPGSQASVANSNLATANVRSPLFLCTGRIEADNTVGSTTASPLGAIEDHGTLLIMNSRLTAGTSGTTESRECPCAFMLFHPSSTRASSVDANETAQLQIADSAITARLETGALVYLTNTNAEVLFENTKFDFDESKAKLLVAEGDNGQEWGNSGKNGAFCGFTARNQNLKGQVEVDTLSSVSLYLLNGSSWTGSSRILSNAGGTPLSENLTVNIDSTSTWTVSEHSTVTNINLADGGKLVDARGRSVKLVDSNGFTLVDGASDIEVTVNGNFSTTVNAAMAAQAKDPSINRAAFDATFGTTTTMGENGTQALTENEQRAQECMEAVRTWFAQL